MLTTHKRFPDIHTIAVLRANALGDLLFSLPAFEALHAAYPNAQITLLGKSWHKAFLEDRPGPIDRVIVVPPTTGVTTLPGETAADDLDEQERFFAAMRQERFDLAVQLHGGGKSSNPFVLRLGARFTIGAKTPDAIALDRWIPYVFYQSEIMRYLEIVALAGAAPVLLEPRVTLTERDRQEAAHVLPENDAPIVALHPGATDPRRQWPPEYFAAVGDALAAQGLRIVVTGAESERAVIAQVPAAMNATALDLGGRLSIGGLAALLARCRVVISNDTGPLHLASAVGAATVGIYWCGNLITYSQITRARHRPIPAWRIHCPVCGRDYIHDRCGHNASLVADVSAQEVLEAARELL